MQTPTSGSKRFVELDALRGVAVIGIAWMNVYIFALPAQAYYNPLAWGGEHAVDRLVWAISFVFVEDKFRTLFAMLFGAGCLILLEKGGIRPWRAHFARMAVLFIIGLTHSTLLASNDVLRAYALAGLALPFLLPLSSRALIAVSIGLVAVHVGGGINVFGGAVFDWYGGRANTDALFFVERNFGHDVGYVQAALGRGYESFSERIVRRFSDIPDQLTVVAGSIPINLAAMTLGMGLWRNRMLAAEWRTFRLQRLAAVGAIISIPALLWFAHFLASQSFPGALVGAVTLIVSAPFDIILGTAYAALAMAFFAPGGSVTERLAAVGRLSLTNYLMTSVILASLFASWGLGLFGEVSRAEAVALSFVPIIAILLWSPWWIARFGQGPFERLWRGATKRLS